MTIGGTVVAKRVGTTGGPHRRRSLPFHLWAHRAGVIGGALVLGAALLALLAPWLAPADPSQLNLRGTFAPPGPRDGLRYALGGDQLGRDVLSRVLYGAQVSLFVGAVAVVGSGAMGIVLGLLSGFYGGKVDTAIMRLLDIQMAIPFLALAITLVAVLGPGLRNTIVALVIGGWVLYARVVRAETLSLREREWVEAARAIGVSNARIMFRHILPNLTSALVVVASFEFARMIIMEASLSFLGLGVQPPTPTWGGMLNDARNYLQVAPWLTAFPGLALVLTVVGANLLGDWLRDALDPRRVGGSALRRPVE